MTGVALTVLSVAVGALLVVVGALWLAWRAERHAADEAEADRDEAVAEARAANRLRRAERIELEADLATARAELHALRRADVADTTPAAEPTWADRDLNTCRQIWAASPTDTPGETR